MAKKRTTKTAARSKQSEPAGWGNSDAEQQERARKALATATRSARALLEFRTPAGILADESDIDPFLQLVDKLAEYFSEPVDMERLIVDAIGARDGNDSRVSKLLGQHCDVSLASTLGAFALGVACGQQQGGAR